MHATQPSAPAKQFEVTSQRLHRQTDHVAQAPFEEMHEGIILLLDRVGSRAALPGARRQVLLQLRGRELLEGYPASLLPAPLRIVRPAPEHHAGPQLVLAATQGRQDA